MVPDFKGLGTAFAIIAVDSFFGLWKLIELLVWLVSKLLGS